MEIVYWLAGGYALLAVWRRISSYRRFTLVRFVPPRYARCNGTDICAGMREMLSRAIETEAQEWTHVGWFHVHTLPGRAALPGGVWRHARDSLAFVTPAYYPEPERRTMATWASWTDGGRLLIGGQDQHIRLMMPQGVEPNAPHGESWAEHQSVVEQVSEPIRHVTVDEALAELNARYAASAQAMLAIGELTRTDEPGVLRYTVRGARPRIAPLRMASARQAGGHASRWVDAEPPAPTEQEVHAEVEAGYRASPAKRRRDAWRGLGVLALTALVAAVSFTVWIPFSKVGLLLVVLLIHEGGHLLAMRAFGYADTAIFFIPFFGGAASGVKRNASAVERVIVALLGPIPGILIALAIAASVDLHSAPEWVWDLTWLCFVVNLFNLAPLLPLDGGHVVNQLLFSRHPRAETALRGVGIVVFLALTWVDFIFGVVALFGVLGWSAGQRLSRLARQAAATHLEGDEPPTEEQRRAVLLQCLYQHEDGGKMSFGTRLQLIRAAEKRGLSAPPTLGAALVLGLIYLLFLVGSPFAMALIR